MVLTLLKKQLLEMFSGYVIDRKTGKARGKKDFVLYVVLYIFIFGGLGMAFYAMASGLGVAMLNHGFNWLYFALMGLLSIALGVFGSVFNTYAGLYLPKDNEFLLSMPIPNRTLVLARTAGVYCMSLMYSAWVWIPAMIAYWIIAPLSVFNVIFPILLTFVLALFVSVLSCILGWVVALIAAKTKGKSFVTVFLSLAVIIGYYVIYFKVVKSLSTIVNHLDELGSAVKSWLRYVYWIGLAADGDMLSLLAVIGITVLLAAVCLFVLAKTFTKFALTAEKGETRVKKQIGYEKRTAKKALLRREYKHFSSLSIWMLNGGLGLLVMPVAAIAVLIKSKAIRTVISQMPAQANPFLSALPIFLIAAVGLAVSMDMIVCCSVSLEGKNLWILQTLPLKPWDVLQAKIKMGFSLNIAPALFLGLSLGIALKLPALQIALILIALVLFVWLTQDFGLFLNLLHPDFNWTNPTTVVKQGLPVFFAMFGGWLFCVLTALGGYFLLKVTGVYVVLIAILILFGALLTLLQRWLKTKGTAIFSVL